LIVVIAGVNGAGKSSIQGAAWRHKGYEYFNPDEYARDLMKKDPKMTLDESNGQAWKRGYDALNEAINHNISFAFESTLGATSIPAALRRAAANGIEIVIYFTGLSSPELHIKRVQARVAKGGHDIPEVKIRERYISSLVNMISLIPYCTELRIIDNSAPLDASGTPSPKTVVWVAKGKFRTFLGAATPVWAKPLVMCVIKHFGYPTAV
jgi:predicted ABC-type ATPase